MKPRPTNGTPTRNPNLTLLTALLLAPLPALAAADAPPRAPARCPPDIKQEEYSGRPMKAQSRQIFRVNQTYTWLREPLLRRLPDGSLCCVFFTGGAGDGHAYPTGIPNPGSKPRLINLPDKRIVLFHNPSEKDFTDT